MGWDAASGWILCRRDVGNRIPVSGYQVLQLSFLRTVIMTLGITPVLNIKQSLGTYPDGAVSYRL